MWWYLAFFLGLTVLYSVFAVTGALDLEPWMAWAGVALFGGMAVYTPFETRNRRRSALALITQLDERLSDQ